MCVYSWCHSHFPQKSPTISGSFARRDRERMCVCLLIQSGKDRQDTFIFVSHFPQKSPMISGSFAKRDLQIKESYVSSPLCTGCFTACMCARATYVHTHVCERTYEQMQTYVRMTPCIRAHRTFYPCKSFSAKEPYD